MPVRKKGVSCKNKANRSLLEYLVSDISLLKGSIEEQIVKGKYFKDKEKQTLKTEDLLNETNSHPDHIENIIDLTGDLVDHSSSSPQDHLTLNGRTKTEKKKKRGKCKKDVKSDHERIKKNHTYSIVTSNTTLNLNHPSSSTIKTMNRTTATDTTATDTKAISPLATSTKAASTIKINTVSASTFATNNITTSTMATNPISTSTITTNTMATSTKSTSTMATSTMATSPMATGQTRMVDFFRVRRTARVCTLSQIKRREEEEMEVVMTEQSREIGSVHLKVVQVTGKGRGVVAARHFARGDFVVEYAGDFISIAEAKVREEGYKRDEVVGCYMYYFKHANKQFCIDATAESDRLGRLLNHTRHHPNCGTKVVEIGGLPRLALVAVREVCEGEELLYDYGDRSKEALAHHPWLVL